MPLATCGSRLLCGKSDVASPRAGLRTSRRLAVMGFCRQEEQSISGRLSKESQWERRRVASGQHHVVEYRMAGSPVWKFAAETELEPPRPPEPASPLAHSLRAPEGIAVIAEIHCLPCGTVSE
jgi:hypothetical protein